MVNVTQLGYLGIGVSDVAAWEQFATHILGLQNNGRDDDGSLFLKMDEYHHHPLPVPGSGCAHRAGYGASHQRPYGVVLYAVAFRL